MKRNTIIAILLMSAGVMSAQEKMIQVFPANRQLPEGMAEQVGVRMPDAEKVRVAENADFVVPVTESENVVPTILAPGMKKAPAAQVSQAGYINPEGTLFLGYTSNGKNTFISSPGVIGAWSSEIPCWIWRNTTTGDYSSIEYVNGFLAKYPTLIEDGESYYIDARYNLYDSIVSAGGYGTYKDSEGDEGYIWQMGVPLQIVHRHEGDEQYVMLTKYTNDANLSSNDCKISAGGLPSANTTDGLWPLTNAVSTNKDGVSTELSYKVGTANHYYFGTTKENNLLPKKIVTHYDQPQAQLYVKSISLALGANSTMKFDTLYVDVYTEKGQLIASSQAPKSSVSSLSIKSSSKMLTFTFEKKSEYNEMLQEGFSVNEPFRVEVYGIKATDNFGIYAAKSSIYESKSEIIMEDGSKLTYDYDPYIMLNGIYPTFEDYFKANKVETGQIGDTIPIKFNLIEGLTYKYGATLAVNEDYDGITEFAIYSTFKPYDEATRYWNLDIERPSYVTMSADYETNISGDDSNPITLWQYYRAFTLYIYASEKPVIGDCIKIGKCGKNIVYRIDAVMEGEENDSLAQKLLDNGRLKIVRDGKSYNALGIRVE